MDQSHSEVVRGDEEQTAILFGVPAAMTAIRLSCFAVSSLVAPHGSTDHVQGIPKIRGQWTTALRRYVCRRQVALPFRGFEKMWEVLHLCAIATEPHQGEQFYPFVGGE